MKYYEYYILRTKTYLSKKFSSTSSALRRNKILPPIGAANSEAPPKIEVVEAQKIESDLELASRETVELIQRLYYGQPKR